MKQYVIYGLAGVGGVYLTTKVTGYILRRYRKQIKASVIDKAAEFFADDETEEETEEKKDDPLVAAFAAYLNAKKGAN